MKMPWRLQELYWALLPHYEIIGHYTGKVIGCTCGKRGQQDVLAEEPLATFHRVSKRKCTCCAKENN